MTPYKRHLRNYQFMKTYSELSSLYRLFHRKCYASEPYCHTSEVSWSHLKLKQDLACQKNVYIYDLVTPVAVRKVIIPTSVRKVKQILDYNDRMTGTYRSKALPILELQLKSLRVDILDKENPTVGSKQ